MNKEDKLRISLLSEFYSTLGSIEDEFGMGKRKSKHKALVKIDKVQRDLINRIEEIKKKQNG